MWLIYGYEFENIYKINKFLKVGNDFKGNRGFNGFMLINVIEVVV